MSHTVSGQIALDSAKIFKDFQILGRTTAGASTHFTDLIVEHCPTFSISRNDLDELHSIAEKSRTKKHRPTKFGQDNIFMLGFLKGKEERIMMEASGRLIVNFANYTEYWPTGEHLERLKNLIEKWKK